MSRLKKIFGQFALLLRVACAVAVLAALALLAPDDWRGHFGRGPAVGGEDAER